jgi:hypothetical protein
MIRKAAVTVMMALVVATAARVGAQAAPGAPTNLNAQVLSDTVSLTWTAAAGAVTTYVIEVGSSSGQADLAIFTTGQATPGFTASRVPPGRYFVRVRAANGAVLGATSNEVSVDVQAQPCVAPHAPSGLSASVAGTTVTLGWTMDVATAAIVLGAGSAPSMSDVFSGDIGRRTSITASAAPGTY